MSTSTSTSCFEFFGTFCSSDEQKKILGEIIEHTKNYLAYLEAQVETELIAITKRSTAAALENYLSYYKHQVGEEYKYTSS